MTHEQKQPTDEELLAQLMEFSDARTYRPTDRVAEPEQMPQAPSGTAMSESGSGSGPEGASGSDPEA